MLGVDLQDRDRTRRRRWPVVAAIVAGAAMAAWLSSCASTAARDPFEVRAGVAFGPPTRQAQAPAGVGGYASQVLRVVVTRGELREPAGGATVMAWDAVEMVWRSAVTGPDGVATLSGIVLVSLVVDGARVDLSGAQADLTRPYLRSIEVQR